MDPAEIREQLLSHGYDPLPLNGKVPPMTEWQKKRANREEILLWSSLYPHCRNTGVLTAYVPAIDCDLLDEEAAIAVEDLARAHFADRGRFLVRIGKAPKRAILFRTKTPFKKITLEVTAPNGIGGKIEVLGDGQQIVVAGDHPDTRKPYTWFGGELWSISIGELPLVAVEEMRSFIDAAATVLKEEHDYQVGNTTQAAGNDDSHDNAARDWGSCLEGILTGNDFHDAVRDLAAKLIVGGLSDGASVNLIRSLMNASAAPRDGRFTERLADIPRAVRTARENLRPPPALQGYTPRPFAEIPRRRWLHAGHFVRRTVTMTVGPGGFGKTSLEICNAVEMVTGKGLIGPAPVEQTNVLYWCGEDEAAEIERRIAATCLHHDVDPELLRDRLFLGNKVTGHGRLASLNHHGDVVLNRPLIDQVIAFINAHSIGVAIFDPLIAFHRVVENSTNMEVVVKDVFEPIAVTTDCCVELCVHTRKPAAGQQGELTADDTRGSSSAVFAARSVRVLNRMSKADAELPGIDDDNRRSYLRVSHDKINLTPPTKATWIRLASVQLPNIDGERPGDNVQTVEAWTYPQPFDKVTVDDMHWMRQEVRERSYRADARAADWGGYALANRLSLDISSPGCPRTPQQAANRKRVALIIKTWISNKALTTVERQDATRHSFDYLMPGPWNDDV
jgi:hypothetical protein